MGGSQEAGAIFWSILSEVPPGNRDSERSSENIEGTVEARERLSVKEREEKTEWGTGSYSRRGLEDFGRSLSSSKRKESLGKDKFGK